MGEPVPNPPECDDVGFGIIQTFYLASRGRGYVGGMAVTPLPLTVQNVSDVLDIYPVLASREVIDNGVFAIDELWLDEWAKSQNKDS